MVYSPYSTQNNLNPRKRSYIITDDLQPKSGLAKINSLKKYTQADS